MDVNDPVPIDVTEPNEVVAVAALPDPGPEPGQADSSLSPGHDAGPQSGQSVSSTAAFLTPHCKQVTTTPQLGFG